MATGKINHPYYPRDMEIPNYIPNESSVTEILVIFFGLVGMLLSATWLYASRMQQLKGRTITKAKICWLVACAAIHIILEGYFGVFYNTLVQEQTYLAQTWKEYGKGDSRYVIGDSFTVCVESITALFVGPMAALTAYAFIQNTPNRHVCQLLTSLCQLYGTILYFTTEIKDGFIHTKLFDPLYFWFYFVFMNILWIIIPSLCVIESCLALNTAVCIAETEELKRKAKKQ